MENSKMSSQTKSHSLFQTLPPARSIVSVWQGWCEEQKKPRYRRTTVLENSIHLPAYPLDMWPLLTLPLGTLDEVGVPYNAPTEKYPATYHPTTIAQYALAHWNSYLATEDEKHRKAFMIQAYWLIQHEERFEDGRSGWLIPFPVPEYYVSKPWLSAMTQGECISVLVRAYRLSGEDAFLQGAQRAIRTFELDIRDGGVCSHTGDEGMFFEEVAAYPSAHILNGYLFALFGLYDYIALTDDPKVVELITSSLITLHKLINTYDVGYWSCYDLLHKRMATQFYHSLHVLQLEALAHLSGCEHCAVVAARWASYQQSSICQLRYFITSRILGSNLFTRWRARYCWLHSSIFFVLLKRGI
jgi:heparosan-N-sulfate-glucuronate 5-epimerase